MDKDWLEMQFRINPGQSKADLARVLNLDPPAISKILAGTRQIKASEYVAMRRFFGMPKEASTPHQASAGASYTLKPLEHGLREQTEAQDEDSWIMPAHLIRSRTQAPPEQIKVFAVNENTMMPDFVPGEQVLVDMSDCKPSPPGVFVLSDGMGHILRQCALVPGSNPLEIKISTRSKQFEDYILPVRDARMIGRVIAKLEWL
jgi:transcriptional regulator with XRE-family HTH domain